MSGGTQAAYGYRYQYLVTAEFFLRYLRDHLSELASTCRMRGAADGAVRGVAADDDIVDFGIEVAGEVTTTVQVKGSASASCNVSPIRVRHTRSSPVSLPARAGQSFLLTNRLLSTSVGEVCGNRCGGRSLEAVVLSERRTLPRKARVPIRSSASMRAHSTNSLSRSPPGAEFRRDRDFNQR